MIGRVWCVAGLDLVISVWAWLPALFCQDTSSILSRYKLSRLSCTEEPPHMYSCSVWPSGSLTLPLMTVLPSPVRKKCHCRCICASWWSDSYNAAVGRTHYLDILYAILDCYLGKCLWVELSSWDIWKRDLKKRGNLNFTKWWFFLQSFFSTQHTVLCLFYPLSGTLSLILIKVHLQIHTLLTTNRSLLLKKVFWA